MNKNIHNIEDMPENVFVLFANGNDSETTISNTLRRQLITFEKKIRRSTRQLSSTTQSSPLVIVFIFENGSKTEMEDSKSELECYFEKFEWS